MFKRFFLFFGINILIVVTISIILSVLGLNNYVQGGQLNLTVLAGFCLIWGMGGAFISLMISKWMAKMLMGIQIIDPNAPGRYASIVESVHRFARQAGLPQMPEVGVYESEEVNAFATGPSKSNSLVAVSTGLLSRMNKDELDGVIGHEVAHIANGDMVTMTLIQGIMNAFVMFFARIAAWAVSNALRGNNDDDRPSPWAPLVNMLLVIVFEIIFGILASIVVAWFSRQREFRADQGGAKLAGKDNMIKALESLKSTYQLLNEKPEGAVRAMQISSKSSFLALFSTHPNLDDRIEALKRS